MKDSIVVENLSKRFQLGALHQETMLREWVMQMLRRPFQSRPAPREVLWALHDVSFRVPKGEVVGIIGRNGAGKSTLLKVLSRIMIPTSGSISVSGRVAALLEVGTGFHEELTGRENIFLNGSIMGMKGRDVAAKLDEIVSFAGVERFLDTPIKRYSSGMRLRLGFAVAAHLDPDVLIIDEVLAVGDAGFQKKCLSTMEGLRSSGRTVLFVSHNMAAVENLCSRGIWIDSGRIREDGAARDVIHSYMGTFAEAQQTGVDLAGLQARRGTGEIRYTGLEFLAPDGSALPMVRSGDRVVIRLRYHAKVPIEYASFGFRLSTELGTVVTETSTWHHGIDVPLVPAGNGYLDLEIDGLNLIPARYLFSLGLTGPAQHLFDFADHCARLDVETSNIYGSGRSLDSRFGIVFFPQRWRMNGVPLTRETSRAGELTEASGSSEG